jgi:hypothetical protein
MAQGERDERGGGGNRGRNRERDVTRGAHAAAVYPFPARVEFFHRPPRRDGPEAPAHQLPSRSSL